MNIVLLVGPLLQNPHYLFLMFAFCTRKLYKLRSSIIVCFIENIKPFIPSLSEEFYIDFSIVIFFRCRAHSDLAKFSN